MSQYGLLGGLGGALQDIGRDMRQNAVAERQRKQQRQEQLQDKEADRAYAEGVRATDRANAMEDRKGLLDYERSLDAGRFTTETADNGVEYQTDEHTGKKSILRDPTSKKFGGSVAGKVQEYNNLIRSGMSSDEAIARLYGGETEQTMAKFAESIVKEEVAEGLVDDDFDPVARRNQIIEQMKASKNKGKNGATEYEPLINQVMKANPSWDEDKAAAYLKHLGKI